MDIIVSASRFDLGRIVTTLGAREALTEDDTLKALVRHMSEDWGDLDPDDRRRNDNALKCGDRLFSRFTSKSGEAFYVITEADRSVTTFLLPDEY